MCGQPPLDIKDQVKYGTNHRKKQRINLVIANVMKLVLFEGVKCGSEMFQ